MHNLKGQILKRKILILHFEIYRSTFHFALYLYFRKFVRDNL